MIKEANAGGTTVGVQGCEVESTKDDIAAAVAAAKDSDTVVMVMGIGQGQEREGQDRYNTTL
jgi:S-adenosylhomocysteine hydrolase